MTGTKSRREVERMLAGRALAVPPGLPQRAGPKWSGEMTGKSIRELTLDAIDQALAESIRQQFITMALADPTDDGGTPLALKRFNRSLPHLANLHNRARTMIGDVFKEETP
jgi:hypothetical protein